MEDPSFFKFGCTIISRILSYPRRNSPVIYLVLASLRRIYLPTLQYTSEQLADSPQKGEVLLVYVAFQPARFILPISYLIRMCALTAQFHPYPNDTVGAVLFL